MQEEHAIGELVGETHVMSNNDAGEFQLELQFFNKVAKQLGHQGVDHRRGLVVQDALGLSGQSTSDGH